MSHAVLEDREGITEALARVRRAMRRHGFAGSLRLAAAHASHLAYLRESHVWYWLGLSEEGWARVALAPGLVLIKAGPPELALLDELPTTMTPRDARRRLAANVDLWMVVEGERPVFSCWTYRGHMPAGAAPDRWICLPPGTAGLEDPVTSAVFRGRSVAPAVWSSVAAALAGEGLSAVLAKVDETNLACRCAIERVGFRAVASMQLERIGGRSRVDVRPYEAGGVGMFLAGQFTP